MFFAYLNSILVVHFLNRKILHMSQTENDLLTSNLLLIPILKLKFLLVFDMFCGYKCLNFLSAYLVY